jgi:hypothetical protein
VKQLRSLALRSWRIEAAATAEVGGALVVLAIDEARELVQTFLADGDKYFRHLRRAMIEVHRLVDGHVRVVAVLTDTLGSISGFVPMARVDPSTCALATARVRLLDPFIL